MKNKLNKLIGARWFFEKCRADSLARENRQLRTKTKWLKEERGRLILELNDRNKENLDLKGQIFGEKLVKYV